MATNVQLALFAAAWIAGVYLLNCLAAHEFKRIQWRPLLLYVTTLAMLGVYGETIYGSLYHFVFGRSLWQYAVSLVHHAYTSHYALLVWGVYGFYLYLMHDNVLKRHTNAEKYLPYIFCIEAVIIEASVNLTFHVAFGRYIFYYLPGDLWHLTSLQTLPIYLAGGYAINAALKKTRSDPFFFSAAAAALAFVLVFLT